MRYKLVSMSITGLAIALFVIIMVPKSVSGQNCGCAQGLCCSKDGYCGNSDAYIVAQGPCFGGQNAPSSTTNDVNVTNIVTPQFFNSINDQADSSCAGKNFYSRDAFLDALNSYNQFGRVGSVEELLHKKLDVSIITLI